MVDYEIREYTKDDTSAMFALWQEIFKDPDEMISGFLRLLPQIGTAVVATVKGEVVGTVYVITALNLYQGTTCQTCGYTYALAVQDSFRHCGIGAALIRNACMVGRQHGASMCCSQPASASLTQWYVNSSFFPYTLCRRTLETPCCPVQEVTKISPAEYLMRRQELCLDEPYLQPSIEMMEMQHTACTVFGGGLFACSDGIAAAFREGDTAVFYEILPWSEKRKDIAAAVGYALGCTESQYFVPDPQGTPFIVSDNPLPEMLDFPFTFA